MCTMKLLLISLSVVMCTEVSGCIIRSCPPKGDEKRYTKDTDYRNLDVCPQCGPEGSGSCIGPSLCCGPFGCLIGTQETKICSLAEPSRYPCAVDGSRCAGRGRCTAPGICCIEDSCRIDEACQENRQRMTAKLVRLARNDECNFRRMDARCMLRILRVK